MRVAALTIRSMTYYLRCTKVHYPAIPVWIRSEAAKERVIQKVIGPKNFVVVRSRRWVTQRVCHCACSMQALYSAAAFRV